MSPLFGKTILLVVSGSVAAVKTPELIGLLQKAGASVRVILTHSGGENITQLTRNQVERYKGAPAGHDDATVYAQILGLCGADNVFTDGDMWPRADAGKATIDHIQFSRDCDLILAPAASANLIARVALGLADDFATTTILASDKDLMLAPAMNWRMWEKEATQANLDILRRRKGVHLVGPVEGDMACNERGMGRMAEPAQILEAVERYARLRDYRPLENRHILVTAGPTAEPFGGVRQLTNLSSGRQGYALADAAARLGASVTLVSGPVDSAVGAGLHPNVTIINVQSARQMLEACLKVLKSTPDTFIAIFAAAVADWHVAGVSYRDAPGKIIPVEPGKKLKKIQAGPPKLILEDNPHILKTIGTHPSLRPALVIGFAAETDDILENAKRKRVDYGADWIAANDVSSETGHMGGETNSIHLVTGQGVDVLPEMHKAEIAWRLLQRVVQEKLPAVYQELNL